MTVEQIILKVKENEPKADLEKIRRAAEFGKKVHGNQRRQTGEPYFEHSLHTAFILAQIKADQETVIAGLLHDVLEDTEVTAEELEKEFGKEIAELVQGVTKLNKIKYRGEERYVENLRKMFVAMAQDLRVILIKFADRLHNLRTLDSHPNPEKQERIARESLEIYAPIAGLLGIWRLKWQIEDLCFKYLYPEEYKKLEYKYEVEKKLERNQYIQKIKVQLSRELKKTGVNHEISSRFKHLYSIWKKMQDKNRAFNEIYDVFALRVVVGDIPDCYKALGIIHSIWKPKPDRFKDYIALPKPNGYRGIHTTVFGPEGKPTEFQIRTREMHEEALYGIAAHWYYKQSREGTKKTGRRQYQPKWIREILEIQRNASDSEEFVNQLKFDIFKDRIFVLTPKGDVIDLPQKATPIDFAYAVHTDIGNKATSVLVNNKMGSLDQELTDGDTVEIVIDKKRNGPNRDWLKFAQTQKAREKIRQYLKESRLEQIKKLLPYHRKK